MPHWCGGGTKAYAYIIICIYYYYKLTLTPLPLALYFFTIQVSVVVCRRCCWPPRTCFAGRHFETGRRREPGRAHQLPHAGQRGGARAGPEPGHHRHASGKISCTDACSVCVCVCGVCKLICSWVMVGTYIACFCFGGFTVLLLFSLSPLYWGLFTF